MNEILSDAERQELRDVLLVWKEGGIENPVIALFEYENDETPLYFGLDDNDDVIIVENYQIKDTVSVSEGENPEDYEEGEGS